MKKPFTKITTILIILMFITNAIIVPAAAMESKAQSKNAQLVPAASNGSTTLPAITVVNSEVVQILSYGSTGYYVTQLQSKLKKIGYFKSEITGKYLSVTKNSVIQYQKNIKLTPNGIVGILTWNSLNKRLGISVNSRGETSSSNKLALFNRVLKIGCKGNDVTELQDKLIKLKLLSGKKDGIYGSMTSGSIKKFQAFKKLTVNGIADELTISHILNTNSIPKEYQNIPTPPVTNLPTTPPAIDVTTDSSIDISIPVPTTTDSSIIIPEENPDTLNIFTGKTIIIDAGHGFSDPGTTKGSIYEKTITLSVAQKLEKMLKDADAEVIMTRSSDSSSGLYYLYYRSAIANRCLLKKEMEKTERAIETLTKDLAQKLKLAESKKQLIDAYLLSSNSIEAQKNLDLRLSLEQEYNLLIQTSLNLKNTLKEKQTTLLDLEQKYEGFDFYMMDPAMKERIGLYDNQSSKANSKLTSVFDLGNTTYTKNMIFISIHVNSTEESETSASGVKIYVSDKSASYYNNYYSNYNQAYREKLGKSLLTNLNATTTFSKKTDKLTKSNLSVLRENNLVSVLVEIGFLNNSSDRKLLQQSATIDNAALGLFNGIKAYFTEVNK